MRVRRSPASWVTLALVLAACSGATAETTTADSQAEPTTTTSTTVATTTTSIELDPVDPALVGATGSDWLLFPDSGNGGYDVSLYDWSLTLSNDLTSLEGVATITATATQDLQRFSLDARDIDVVSVDVDGDEADYVTTGLELIITLGEPLDPGEEFNVTVDYSAEPERYMPPGVPFGMGWDVQPSVLLLTHGFPGATATWVPTNERKDERARYVIRLDVPEGFTGTASGFPVEDESSFVWDTGEEVDATGFSVAQYETSTFEWNGIPIELSLTPDSATRAIYEANIPVILDFLEGLFGPYPYERLGISAINGKQFALAVPMRVFIPDSAPGPILTHELAHQWAGNAVSSADMERNNWIYEGLATYAESLFAEHEGRDLDAITTSLDLQVPDETRALDAVDSIDDILDAATYRRSALLYHALRLEIGDDAFFATLRQFIESNIGGTAEITDLQAIAEMLSGEDLGDFFTGWVSESAVPTLTTDAG